MHIQRTYKITKSVPPSHAESCVLNTMDELLPQLPNLVSLFIQVRQPRICFGEKTLHFKNNFKTRCVPTAEVSFMSEYVSMILPLLCKTYLHTQMNW